MRSLPASVSWSMECGDSISLISCGGLWWSSEEGVAVLRKHFFPLRELEPATRGGVFFPLFLAWPFGATQKNSGPLSLWYSEICNQLFLGLWKDTCLAFPEIREHFPKGVVTHDTPNRSVRVLRLLRTLSDMWWCQPLFSHPFQDAVVSHCGCDLCVPDDGWCWKFYHVVISPLYIFFCQVPL